MFTHIMVGASDLEKSRAFYDAIFATLDVKGPMQDGNRYFYRGGGINFAITTPIDGNPATFANGGTIGFRADSPEQADAFHAAGLANGGTACEEPPGIRSGGFGDMYIAYLRDPDGNKICALHRVPTADG